MDDYVKFCMKCGWNDPDMGCSSNLDEAVYQCPLYIHYHPEEAAQFERDMQEWISMDDIIREEEQKNDKI